MAALAQTTASLLGELRVQVTPGNATSCAYCNAALDVKCVALGTSADALFCSRDCASRSAIRRLIASEEVRTPSVSQTSRIAASAAEAAAAAEARRQASAGGVASAPVSVRIDAARALAVTARMLDARFSLADQPWVSLAAESGCVAAAALLRAVAAELDACADATGTCTIALDALLPCLRASREIAANAGAADAAVAAAPAAPAEGSDSAADVWISEGLRLAELDCYDARLASGALIRLVAPPVRLRRDPPHVTLLAHGHRHSTTPLMADLDPSEPFIAALLADGTVVGMTSYRRSGRVVGDAMADLADLRAAAEQRYGVARRVVVEGRSMGGAVATRLAERLPGVCDGVVAIGAALLVTEGAEDGASAPCPPLLHTPVVPILFLTNVSELSPIREYIAGVERARATRERLGACDDEQELVLPSLWQVWREGHNAVSWRERLAAHRHLGAWLDHGSFVTVRQANVHLRGDDAARLPRPVLRLSAGAQARLADVQVLGVHVVFGSFSLALAESDLAAIGVGQSRCFRLTTPADVSVVVRFGAFPFLGSQVGEYIAFESPDGGIIVSVFGWYEAHASARELNLAPGDRVVVQRAAEQQASRVVRRDL